jgi:hypothetical protein
LRQDIDGAHSLPEKLDVLFMSFLSGHPSRAERAMLDEVIAERGDRALGDVTRALLTGSQFIFFQ